MQTDSIGTQICVFCCAAMLAAISAMASSQEKISPPSGEDDQVAAKIGDWPITVSRVKRHLEITLGSRKVPAAALPRVRAEALEHLVNRQIVLDFINQDFRAGESEIRSEISVLESNLARVDQTIEEHLIQRGQTREDLENEIAWKIAWKRYLDRKLTEKTLSNYFQNNRRIFDGTEIRIAHILFENNVPVEQQLANARDVRSQITEGKTSWEDAVRTYSRAAESSKFAGEIGWIRFIEPMPEVFNDAAFRLETGQISQAVRTTFGVHLIKCLEIKPGSVGPRDAEEQLRQHATRALFDRIAQRHRDQVKITYTDNWPNLESLNEHPGK